MEGSGGASIEEDYIYLDPKQPRSAGISTSSTGNSPQKSSKRTSYQEAFVFVVGGGNYVEYQNVQELVQVSDIRYYRFMMYLLK